MSENKNFFRASAEDFKKIPGSPVAYWVSHQLFNLLSGQTFESKIEGRIGLATGNNERHLRLWFELPNSHIGYGYDRAGAKESGLRWFPINKAGEFRRWYGNVEYVVNWKDDGVELQTTLHPDGHRIWAHNFNLDYIFKPHIGWSNITSGTVSFRKYERGFLFDASANAAYADEGHYDYLLGISNTCFVFLPPGPSSKVKYITFVSASSAEANVVEKQENISKNNIDSLRIIPFIRIPPLYFLKIVCHINIFLFILYNRNNREVKFWKIRQKALIQ